MRLLFSDILQNSFQQSINQQYQVEIKEKECKTRTLDIYIYKQTCLEMNNDY